MYVYVKMEMKATAGKQTILFAKLISLLQSTQQAASLVQLGELG